MWRRAGNDINGAFGDLGTFLPYVVAAIGVGGLAPGGVFTGFGVFLIASGCAFRLPIAVQPMKAVAAALLTAALTPGEIATAGMVLGLLFLLLGLGGGIGWIARLIPPSITAGLQLGLGVAMAVMGARLVSGDPWLGVATLVFSFLALRITVIPLLPLALAAALATAIGTGAIDAEALAPWVFSWPAMVLPAAGDLRAALERAVVPQIPLTIANAVIVTAAVVRTAFPDRVAQVDEPRLALSTGLGNLLLCPFGAMPMCHGAGGLVAQMRFGARTGAAPAMLGTLLLTAGLLFADGTAFLLASIPLAAAGALLAIAGLDLAWSPRLLDARSDCRPVIGATALAAWLLNPAVGLAIGFAMEIVRSRLRAWADRRRS